MLLQKYLSLHEWELNELPFLNTIVGRHVYACIAREILSGNKNENMSTKQLLSTSHFTDRAIRFKIKEMHDSGFLYTEIGIDDRRLRTIRATDALKFLIHEHSNRFDKEISNDLMIIKK